MTAQEKLQAMTQNRWIMIPLALVGAVGGIIAVVGGFRTLFYLVTLYGAR
jgi:hypothetical protein